MAPPAGSPTSWADLPAEIRVHIYEYVLTFDCAIKKIPIKAAKSKSQASGGTLPRIRRAFSLLAVNKQITREVLPVLYECNTISLTHMALHSLMSPARQLDLAYVRHLNIRFVPKPEDQWLWCGSCKEITPMVLMVTAPHFRTLQTAVIHFDARWCTPTNVIATKRELSKAGMDIEFTSVGRFRVTGTKEGTEVSFEHKDLARFWELTAALDDDTIVYWGRTTRHEAPFVDIDLPTPVKIDIFDILFFHRMPKLRPQGAILMSGIQPEWLGPEFPRSEAYACITLCYEDMIRAP